MTPQEKLKSILSNEYESEDGDTYKVELLSGMTDAELNKLEDNLPNKYLPNEIKELLKFSKGFKFFGLEEVNFNAYGYFGFEEMFPYSIQLAGDGFGNFWILDIDSKGNWGKVYYICHDPAVVVKHSENLTEFIEHVDEFGRMGKDSHLDNIHEKVVQEIWQNESEEVGNIEKDYSFDTKQVLLPKNYIVADLTDKPTTAGFAWGKSGSNTKIIRPSDAPIWLVEKKVKQSFLSRLFNKIK